MKTIRFYVVWSCVLQQIKSDSYGDFIVKPPDVLKVEIGKEATFTWLYNPPGSQLVLQKWCKLDPVRKQCTSNILMTKTATDAVPVVRTTNVEYAKRITGQAPLIMKISDLRLSDIGVFEFSATFQNGLVYYDRVHLMVLVKPVISLRSSESRVITEGLKLRFECGVGAGNPKPFTIEWWHNNVMISSVKSNFEAPLIFNPALKKDKGTYRCIARNDGGLDSYVINLDVQSFAQTAPPMLQLGAIDYAIINQTIPNGAIIHNVLATDPDNGQLTFSIIGVKYYKNGTEAPVSAAKASWALKERPINTTKTQCALAETYPFPRNLFCMDPSTNAVKTTSVYNKAIKADFSLFVVTVFVIDNGSYPLNLTTKVYFRVRDNCTDSTGDYTNLVTSCPEAKEIIRQTGLQNEIGFMFNVPNNTRISRVTVDFGQFSPFKVIEDFVSYKFEYFVGKTSKLATVNRRMLVNTTLDRKIEMFLWKPIEIIGDRATVAVTLRVQSGKNELSGRGQGIELFLVNRSRDYCANSKCVGLYGSLSKSMGVNGGKPECTRRDQFVVVDKYSPCPGALPNTAPVLLPGTTDYAIINQTLPNGAIIHRLFVTDPENGKLTFSIIGVTYYKNGTEAPVSAAKASWALKERPINTTKTQCALAETYPFPRNLFCMDPSTNAVKTTSVYNKAIKADFSLFVVTVFVIDNGSPALNLTTKVYFRVRDNCTDSTGDYTNLVTSCPEAKEIIRQTGFQNEIGFTFNVPNNTRISRVTVDFGQFSPFKVIEDFVSYKFEYFVGKTRKTATVNRRLLVNTTLDRKIEMFLWKPIEIIGDRATVAVTLRVQSGKNELSGRGQGIELFLVNRSRDYCANSKCVGLYGSLSKSMGVNGGKPECTRRDQFVVVDKYSPCPGALPNTAPVLLPGTTDYAIINQTLPNGAIIHRLFVTDPENGKLTFSIIGVTYYKNGTEAPVSAAKASWALKERPINTTKTQCALAETYPFPRNLFCMDPSTNAVKTTSVYNKAIKADFSLFVVTVFVIDNGSPALNLTTKVYFRVRDNCTDSTGDYTNLVTSCPEAKEIIRQTGLQSEIGFMFNVPNNTRISRMTVDFGQFSPFKVIEDFVSYKFEYFVGKTRKTATVNRRLLVNTTLDRKIEMFLWKPIEIIGDRATVAVTLRVQSGKNELSGRGQGIELFLVNRSRDYCANSKCVGLYGSLSKSMGVNGGKPECTRRDQFVVVDKYSPCNANEPPSIRVSNIELKDAPVQGQIIGRIIGTDREGTNLTYGILWVHSKALGKTAVESSMFTGRTCAEASKTVAPLNYICVDPKTGDIKVTSEFRYTFGEKLIVNAFVIDSGTPRQQKTGVFEINIKDPCETAKARYKTLSASCMNGSSIFVTGRNAGDKLKFTSSYDRVVRIGINKTLVAFPRDALYTVFTLRQMISAGKAFRHGNQSRVVYNNTVYDARNVSYIQLPLELSFHGIDHAELSATSHINSSTSSISISLADTGIRLYVHSFKATCGSTSCVTTYRSWVHETNRLGLNACNSDPISVHQYFNICSSPPVFHVQPKDTKATLNSAIVVNCAYQNFTMATFQWIKDGQIFVPPRQLPNADAYEEDQVLIQQNNRWQNVMSMTMNANEPELQGYYHCMVKDALNHVVNSTKSLLRFRDVSSSRMEMKLNQQFSNALHDKASSQYLKLSNEVTTAFHNMFNHNNMHKQRKIVIKDFRPGSVIASADVYYLNVTDKNRQDLCSQFKSLSVTSAGTNLQVASVNTVSYDCCYKEQTGEANIKGVITWRPVIADSFDTQRCPYPFFDSTFNDTIFNSAQRYCMPNFKEGAKWKAPNTSECAYKTLTTWRLEQMSMTNVSDSNAEQIATDLDTITSSDSEITNRLDVKFTADTVASLVNSNKKLSQIATYIVNATSNMMDFNETYVAESQMQYKSSSKVLTSLDSLALQLDVSQNTTIKTTSKNLALTIKPIKRASKEIVIKAKRDQRSGYSNIDIEESNAIISQTTKAETAEILLSEELLRVAASLEPSSFNRIYSFVFESDRLFKSKTQLEQSLNFSTGHLEVVKSRVNSRILSASIGRIKLRNLTGNEEMKGRFKILSDTPGETQCVFWDFEASHGFGAWSSNGCRPVGMNKDMQKCRCNHLTNFAILLDVSGKGTPKEAALALSIITYVGCAISLLCLLITLVTFAVFKKLREKRPSRILMCLCVALVLTLIVFLSGIRAKDLKSCQAVAVLIHYLVLVSFMWMAVEGFNLYLSFVKVLNTGIARFMLKSSLFAWGLPIVIVTISAAATNLNAYGKKNGDDEWLCMVTGTAFYVAYILPILLVVVANLITMGFVIKSLKRSSQVSKDRKMSKVTMARIAAACSVLMGTTWIIGLFAVDALTIPMQLLFCIFNSLQGFFIFIFYCVRNKDAKKEWMETLGSKSTEESKSSSMGFHKNRAGKESVDCNKRLMVSQNVSQNFYELERQDNRTSTLTASVHETAAADNIVSLKPFSHNEPLKGQVGEEENANHGSGKTSTDDAIGMEKIEIEVQLSEHIGSHSHQDNDL